MQKFISSNMFGGTSTQAGVSQGQSESQIAPIPIQSSTSVSHQNMDHLQRLHINSLATNIPNISSIPLHPGFLQTPQNNPAPSLSSPQCRNPMCTTCSHVPSPVEQVEIYKKKLEFCKKEFDKCYNSLIAEQVKVKDLMKLANDQGSENRKMNERLNYHDTKCDDMKNFYRGDIIRLNDLVLGYQKNEEEYEVRIAKHEEKEKIMEAALKECLEFMRNVNFDFKKNVKNLTDKYCEDSSELVELGEGQAESFVNETEAVIKEVELEKSKFNETLSVMVELVDMGFEECSKQNEQLKAENVALIEKKDKLFRNKVKRRRTTEGSENKNNDDDHQRSEHGYISGGKKKARKYFEGEKKNCKLFDGKDLLIGKDLGNCITLHYSGRNEDEDVEKADMTNEELNRSSSGDQRDEGLKKYGALSDLFCKTCCAPSLNQEALDEHLKTGCSTGIIRYTESSHFAEGELLEV